MIRQAALGLALAGAALPVAAAEGGKVRGGEHGDFSRVVLVIEPTTEWSLETVAGRATIRFPGKQLAFDPDGVFAKMPATRVLAVRSSVDAGGTTVVVDLGCDCRVSTSFVGARYLALDVGDRVEAPAPAVAAETPEARTARETVAVATAEQLLIRQIERAAGQGLVEMSEGERGAAPADAPVPEAEPAEPEAPAPDVTEPPARPRPPGRTVVAEGMALLDEQDQIDATTVFDRDSQRAMARTADVPVPSACRPDEDLDVGAWSNGLPLTAQLPTMRRQLVGEFDAPDPAGVRDLARLYIRFGFGAEAQTLVTGFGDEVALEDGPLLADLARVVDGRPAAEGGPLAFAGPCPGRHGLWLALGGRSPVFHDATGFAEVQAAFESLPVDLRAALGPGFIGRLVDASHPAEARLIYDTTVRAGGASTVPVRLAEARLMAAEGHTLEAAQALMALTESADFAATEALTHLVRLALDGELPIPDKVVTDLRAAALQYRGSDREAELRSLLAAALARRAELPEAIGEARQAMRDLPQAAEGFAALAVRSLAEADPAVVGPAVYAETTLATADLLARTPARGAARRTIAAHLVAIGLPDPALAMLAPALIVDDPAARLVAAAAQLRLGETAAARGVLGSLEGREAAELRARSFALDGEYEQAVAALTAGGLDAATYAWPSGDWPRARDAAAGDPQRLAMAAYMAAQTGGAAPEPSADPAALQPELAFQEPLPGLDRPSLGAARRLLSAGPQIGGFVEDVLAGE